MPSTKPSDFDHPKVMEVFGMLRDGRMDRREFIRVAALLGTSAASAYAMAGLPTPAFASSLPFGADAGACPIATCGLPGHRGGGRRARRDGSVDGHR